MMRQADSLARLPGLRHGFFTREGGVSAGVYASLNCGFSSGDEPALVRENRARAVQRLGMPADSLRTVRQVHGRDVLLVRDPAPGGPATLADALVSDRRGITLGVLGADCTPVLLADVEAGVIGAAHAGWRGALAGVIEAALERMVELGAKRARIAAAIGPCIAQPSYEVGPELRAEVVAGDPGSERLFQAVPGSDRLLFDLKGYARRRLERAGVGACDVLPHDTAADEASFFSHRRTRRQGGARFGLLLSALALAS